MELDLKNKCRVCFNSSDEFYNIYDEFDQSLTLLDIFIDTTNFQINEDSELSSYLCKKCTSIIVDFYNLKIIYNENQNQMHEFLSSLDNSETTSNLDESNQLDDKITSKQDDNDSDHNHNESDTIKVEIYSGSDDEQPAETEKESDETSASIDDDHNHDDNDKEEQITISYDNANVDYYQEVKNNEITKYILCPKCGEIFHNENEIENHLIIKHEMLEMANDDDDDQLIRKSDSISEFVDILDNQKKNICDICGASFIKKSYLKDHKEIHDTERRYICNYCNKTFKRRTVLVKHKRIHTHPRQCICEICGKAFNDKGTLKTHIMLLHVKLRNYDCMICGMKFPLKATLEKHIRRHQNKQREYFCAHCPLGYKDKSSLDRHIYIKHSGINTKVTCNECGKQYSTISNLLKHKRICHENNEQINGSNTEEIDETSLS